MQNSEGGIQNVECEINTRNYLAVFTVPTVVSGPWSRSPDDGSTRL